jgi:hypothetical protein
MLKLERMKKKKKIENIKSIELAVPLDGSLGQKPARGAS